MSSVLQPWVEGLTFMMQSVLITAVRSPDTLYKDHPAKVLMRWYRRCVLYSAFEHRILETPAEPGGGSFTGPINESAAKQEYFQRLDELPLHFHLHLVHAAEILGYKHPRERVRVWWVSFYRAAVNDMHLNMETEAELDFRLGDNEAQWRAKEAFPAHGNLPHATLPGALST